MKRKAILIESSDVKGHTDLPGARVDIANWELFLRSDYGGGWTDSEIVVLRKPFSSDVEEALDQPADCYCFVTFSGHGHEGTVVLNDHYESYPISGLRPKGDKGTLIIDSCRGADEAQTYSFSSMQSFANMSRSAIVAMNAQVAESLENFQKRESIKQAHTANASEVNWIKALIAASNGVVEMYSCAKGEIADEDPNSGGYYTSLLLQSAELWVKRASAEKIHTTKDAHTYAALKLHPQQNPEYKPSYLSFPFAAKE